MNGYLSITHHIIPKYFYLLFNLFASVLRLTLNKLNTNFFFFSEMTFVLLVMDGLRRFNESSVCFIKNNEL